MQILNFIAQTLLGELIIVIVGVLFAYVIKRQYDNWRYGRWHVRIFQDSTEVVNRPISPRKTQEILDEPADLAVFLKGVASPYDWINCDIVSDGQEIGLLKIDRDQRQFLIDLDKNPSKARAETEIKVSSPLNQPQEEPVILNFSHPLTANQQEQIATITGQPIGHIHDIPNQMDNSRPFTPQIQTVVNQIELTPKQWQTAPILVNPPAYAPAAAATLAELHGRIGHFPTIIRIRPVSNTDPTRYEIAELINLQTVRENAREQRG